MSSPNPPRQLGQEVDQLGTINEKEVDARIRSMDADTKVRSRMAVTIGLLFVALNAAVMVLVWNAIESDIALLRDKLIQNNQRLITENVFMSLIGATVVQVGITLVAITGYLFPKKQQ